MLQIALPLSPRVINIHDAPPAWLWSEAFTYIGRNRRWGDTKWGNPFKCYDPMQRQTVIHQYEIYIMKSPLMKELHTLTNKTLICHCKPLACHGDILIDLYNKYVRGF